MIKFNIKNYMKYKGIRQPFAFLKKNGFSPNEAAQITKDKLNSITPNLVERLCITMNCLPNDLFYWKEDKNDKISKDYKIWEISKTKNKLN